MDGKLDKSVVTITPTDLYHRRVYLEPLALDLTLDAGTFASLSLDFEGKEITIAFEPAQANNYTYSARRLRVEKMSDARPGENFVLTPTSPFKRGAYVIPVDIDTVKLSW